MRIDRLTIARFKNLSDLAVDFDEESLSTVLIGRNGTGKSNLLEALVIIFRDLDLGQRPAFAYTIRYLCRGRNVEIRADPDRHPGHTSATVDGEGVSFAQLVRPDESGRSPYLPKYVFGYYSGTSDRLGQHFQKHQDRFYKDLIAPGAEEQKLPLRPLFFARLVHSQFVLLSFFLGRDQDARRFLADYLSITELESVLFVMTTPPWARRENRSERFWGATGVVRGFLERLYDCALAPLRLPVSASEERLYLFVKDTDALESLYRHYNTQSDFFKTLESTYISELIQEVRIRVRVRGMETPLTFAELSEGEQQLLTVLGLVRFTSEDESLFLLDEPDTHLNPAWSLQYVELLNRVGHRSESSHIVLTTHDPLTVGGLLRSQLQVLYRDTDTGRTAVTQPDENPIGMGAEALLTSELFGLRSTVDPETLRRLERKRELASKERLTKEEQAELDALNDIVGNLDLTRTMRDPLYKPFVEAMVATGEYRELRKLVLSPDEIRKQTELAERIVRELQSERGP